MGNNKIVALVGGVLDLVIRVALIILVIYFIYTGATRCYDYGYRIFTEEPMTIGEGELKIVSVPVDISAMDLGELFEKNGLTRDKYLFMLQYYASEYREDMKPGTYTLSTAMTAEEMVAAMASTSESGEEEQQLEVLENSQPTGEADEEAEMPPAGGEETP